MAGDIRRLVETASIVYAEDGGVTRRHHPLGHKIPRSVSYVHSSGLTSLPAHDAGLANLRAAIQRPILDLDASESGSVWRALLSNPGFLLQLPPPDPGALLKRGIVVPTGDAELVRHFAIGTVLRHEGESMAADGSVRSSRFAGVARLSILVDRSGRRAIDAWVEPEWKQSTQLVASWMARQLAAGGERAIDRMATTPLGMVVHADRSTVVDAEVAHSLRAPAAAFGLSLRPLLLGVSDFGQVKSSLSRESPAALIVVGPGDDVAASLIRTYGNASSGPVLQVDSTDRLDAIGVLTDAFAAICGVTPSLHVVGEGQGSEVDADERPRPPISTPAECLHDANERWYIRDAATETWWTADTAGHTGTVFKSYRRTNEHLIHVADHGENGVVIHKHKGSVGKTIRMRDLHGCGDPRKHIR